MTTGFDFNELTLEAGMPVRGFVGKFAGIFEAENQGRQSNANTVRVEWRFTDVKFYDTLAPMTDGQQYAITVNYNQYSMSGPWSFITESIKRVMKVSRGVKGSELVGKYFNCAYTNGHPGNRPDPTREGEWMSVEVPAWEVIAIGNAAKGDVMDVRSKDYLEMVQGGSSEDEQTIPANTSPVSALSREVALAQCANGVAVGSFDSVAFQDDGVASVEGLAEAIIVEGEEAILAPLIANGLLTVQNDTYVDTLE